MTMKTNRILAALLILTPVALPAADVAAPVEQAMLRIACEGENAYSEITINGKFKGTCPLDVQVPAGTVIVKAVRDVGGERERNFDRTLRIGGDVVQRLEIKLDRPHMNPEATRRVAAIEEQEALQREANRRGQLPALTKAAESGSVQAMLQLGLMYDRGLVGEVNYKEAAVWLRKAADNNNATALFEFHRYLAMGRGGVAKDQAQSLAVLRRAAEAGDGAAMELVGTNYLIEKNERLAIEWYEKGARANSWQAMNALVLNPEMDDATRYQLGKVWFPKRIEPLQQAADYGDMDAAKELALIYSEKGDVDASEKLFRNVFRTYKKAAATGDVLAIQSLAFSYQYGAFGAPEDKEMAIKLYKQALAGGLRVEDILRKLEAQ